MKILHIFLLFSLLTIVSCTKQDRENTIIEQEGKIDTYIASLSNVEVVRNNGSNRVIVSQGTQSEPVAIGDSLYIRYAGYIFSNGKGDLIVTNDPDIAQKSNFPCQVTPEKIKLGSSKLVKGLEFGLDGVKEGEYCYIIFSAKYGFDNTQVYNIPKTTPLFYEVWIDKVIK